MSYSDISSQQSVNEEYFRKRIQPVICKQDDIFGDPVSPEESGYESIMERMQSNESDQSDGEGQKVQIKRSPKEVKKGSFDFDRKGEDYDYDSQESEHQQQNPAQPQEKEAEPKPLQQEKYQSQLEQINPEPQEQYSSSSSSEQEQDQFSDHSSEQQQHGSLEVAEIQSRLEKVPIEPKQEPELQPQPEPKPTALPPQKPKEHRSSEKKRSGNYIFQGQPVMIGGGEDGQHHRQDPAGTQVNLLKNGSSEQNRANAMQQEARKAVPIIRNEKSRLNVEKQASRAYVLEREEEEIQIPMASKQLKLQHDIVNSNLRQYIQSELQNERELRMKFYEQLSQKIENSVESVITQKIEQSQLQIKTQLSTIKDLLTKVIEMNENTNRRMEALQRKIEQVNKPKK